MLGKCSDNNGMKYQTSKKCVYLQPIWQKME